MQDKTESKQLEEEAERNDRLRAMGEMAAGIAHEIRNPLASIELFASILKKDSQGDTEKMKLSDHIVSGVKNMDRIISSLLLFAKSPEPSRQQCNINDLLRDILDSKTDLQSPDTIHIQCDYCKEEPMAQGDRELLQQVFLNFIRNAVQAMPDGGNLTLRIEKNKSSDNHTYHRHFITTTISDTGVGISSEDRESIFNPFFSTKDKGTGLGLAIAHNIVKAHQAPSTLKAKRAKAPNLPSTCRGGNDMTDHASKKILIVDDEPEMRIAITEALKREGYQTDSAESAPDALHRLEGETFDLVISDVKMPKMSGQELLREIKEQSPNTLVIMMTPTAPSTTQWSP